MKFIYAFISVIAFLILIGCWTKKKPDDSFQSFDVPPVASTFHRPQKYINQPIGSVSRTLKIALNRAGNIIYQDDKNFILLEAKEGVVSFISIDYMLPTKCKQRGGFAPGQFLSPLGIDLAELDQKNEQEHRYVFSDHVNRLQVSVACIDGGSITTSFSSTYYQE